MSVLQIRSLNTADVADSERVIRWQAHTDELLFHAQYSVYSTVGFRAEQRSAVLGDLGLFYISCSSHAVERTAALVRDAPKESVFLSLIIEGQATHCSATDVHRVRPGEFLLYSAHDPYLMAFTDGTRQLTIEVPEDWAWERGAPVGAGNAELFDLARQRATGISAAHVMSCLRVLRDPAADFRGEHRRLRSAMLSLSRHTSRAPARYLDQAMRHIDDNLADVDLDLTSLSRAVGISPRQLSREFALTGRSPAQHILHKRTEAGRDLVTSSALNITEIAEACGFASPGTFARAFKRTTGLSPREFRRQAVVS